MQRAKGFAKTRRHLGPGRVERAGVRWLPRSRCALARTDLNWLFSPATPLPCPLARRPQVAQRSSSHTPPPGVCRQRLNHAVRQAAPLCLRCDARPSPAPRHGNPNRACLFEEGGWEKRSGLGRSPPGVAEPAALRGARETRNRHCAGASPSCVIESPYRPLSQNRFGGGKY